MLIYYICWYGFRAWCLHPFARDWFISKLQGTAKEMPHRLSICAKADRFIAEDMLLLISYIVPWIFLGSASSGSQKARDFWKHNKKETYFQLCWASQTRIPQREGPPTLSPRLQPLPSWRTAQGKPTRCLQHGTVPRTTTRATWVSGQSVTAQNFGLHIEIKKRNKDNQGFTIANITLLRDKVLTRCSCQANWATSSLPVGSTA